MISDGETVTLRMAKRGLTRDGVICARFNNKKDGVSLNITLHSRELCEFFVDEHPSARVHLTGYELLFLL